MLSLQISKSHSSAERGKPSPFETPKSDSSPYATPSGHRLATPTTPGHPEIAFPHS